MASTGKGRQLRSPSENNRGGPKVSRQKEVFIEVVPISSQKRYESRARVHSRKQIAQLAKSIEKFGIVVPILVKREDVGGVSIGFRTTKQKGGAL